jgi:hypothetical protein
VNGRSALKKRPALCIESVLRQVANAVEPVIEHHPRDVLRERSGDGHVERMGVEVREAGLQNLAGEMLAKGGQPNAVPNVGMISASRRGS